jgi:histidine ammonia-lyase
VRLDEAGHRAGVGQQGAPTVSFGRAPISINAVVMLAQGRARAALDRGLEARGRIQASVSSLARRMKTGEPIYGVSTGFGESCTNTVAGDDVTALPLNLVRFHGCGTGRLLSDVEAAAVVAARIASLSRGHSAVREVLLENLCALLNTGVLPCIPEEGSVGASGDLTPLSYVASLLVGEREAMKGGRVIPAAIALIEAGLEPLVLAPKEGLALMNGTSAMTGLACLAFDRSNRLARFAASLTAMLSDVLGSNRGHFHPRIFELKPHPGQRLVGRWIGDDIEYRAEEGIHTGRLQDRYSIRCAPHVVGLLMDALGAVRPMLEVELNSVNDNPIIDAESELILHGGNFYGGHVCFAMDSLKAAVASVADLMDRQMVLLCNPATNNGLPGDLVGATGPGRLAHHGFKAMQIATSALAAEALKLTMPAAAFSRSTESHNQDKVSMGTIAARDCLRMLELTERIAAILLLACCQAVDLRGLEGCHHRSRVLHAAIRKVAAFNGGDRRQDVDIAAVLAHYARGELPTGTPHAAHRGALTLDSFAALSSELA